MMWTTISPPSTSTHSPVCSPSTPRMVAPAPFSASRTCCDSAFTCRAESAVAMISVSYMEVSLRTSRTVMSRALMSSRAATAVLSNFLRRIRFRAIKMIAANIVQNRCGKQTAHAFAPRVAQREFGANRAGCDRLRRHGDACDRSRERTLEARGVGGQSPLPVQLQWRLERCVGPGSTGSLDHDEMREREQALPVPPLRKSGERVAADDHRERQTGLLRVQRFERGN